MKPTEGKILAPNRILTPEARAVYTYLFEPDTFSDTPSYGITLLFPKTTDLTSLVKPVSLIAAGKFGPKKYDLSKTFKSGNAKIDKGGADYFSDVTFITARSKYKPDILKAVNGKVVPIADPEEVYWGMHVRAVVKPFYFNRKGNQGISFALLSVMKVRDDEKFSGNSEEDYEDCIGAYNTNDLDGGVLSDEEYWGADSGTVDGSDMLD